MKPMSRIALPALAWTGAALLATTLLVGCSAFLVAVFGLGVPLLLAVVLGVVP